MRLISFHQPRCPLLISLLFTEQTKFLRSILEKSFLQTERKLDFEIKSDSDTSSFILKINTNFSENVSSIERGVFHFYFSKELDKTVVISAKYLVKSPVEEILFEERVVLLEKECIKFSSEYQFFIFPSYTNKQLVDKVKSSKKISTSVIQVTTKFQNYINVVAIPWGRTFRIIL